MVSGGQVASVLIHERRLRAMCERLVCASFERGRQMDVLRIVPEESGRKGRGNISYRRSVYK